MKNGRWNSSVLLMLFWMFASTYCVPSTNHLMEADVHSTVYTWYAPTFETFALPP
jgi:hypothetical protein